MKKIYKLKALHMLLLFATMVFVFMTMLPSAAHAVSANDEFNPSANGGVWYMALQADGKILAGGGFTNIGGQARNRIARLNADGTADTFNPNADNSVGPMAVQTDGKIVVGGSFANIGGQARNRIARLNTDGTTDAIDPNANGTVNSLAIQPDGKIVVGGGFTSIVATTRNHIARLNADGSLDVAFNPNLNGDVYAVAVQRDSKILIGGNFTTVGGQARSKIARLNADGTLDTAFNPNADAWVYALVVQADGKILTGGEFTTIGGQPRNRIARLNADGTADMTFDPNADNSVYSLALQADGEILVGGIFTTIGGQARSRIARLHSDDGTADTTFNPSANVNVGPIVVQADGKIVVGGDFTTIGGQTRNHIARLYSDGSLDQNTNPNANNVVYTTAVQADGKILIGGSFTFLGGTTRNRIARLNIDGSLDTVFNPNADNTVVTTSLQTDGKIVIGGTFATVGGVTRNRIARLNADGSLDTAFNPNAGSTVFSTAVQANGKILIGGDFTSIGGVTRNRIARLNTNGSLDTVFNPDANNAVNPMLEQADGKILIGGGFTTIGGVFRNRIARLNADGSLDTSFNPDANQFVYSIALQADGKILVGGVFTTMGGTTRNNIARLNPDGSLDADFNPDANARVHAISVQADGKILIGGYFTTIGGVTRNYVARLNPDGSLDTSFSQDTNGYIMVLTEQADGKIVIGGGFNVIGGQSRGFVARITNTAAAMQKLTVAGDGTSVTWARSGAGPEIANVLFEESADGISWTTLGSGTRIAGGWKLEGLSLPMGQNRYIWASGIAIGGMYNASTSIIESGLLYYLHTPNIVISPASPYNFNSVGLGVPATQTFTISNIGMGELVVSSDVSLSGSGDYTLAVSGGNATCGSLQPTIPPGSDCKVDVTFTPSTAGLKSTTLIVSSNDPDSPVSEVAISGSGVGDTIPPTVQSTSPASNATSVALNSSVTITFSENIDCDTVNTTNISISSGGWSLLSCSGNQAVFTTSSQVSGTLYTVTVTASVTDTSSNPIAASYSYSYTTIRSCENVSDGLVGWWKGENDALDQKLHNGTLQNGVSFAPGKIGQAFSFNGSSTYVNIPDSGDFRMFSWTLEAWINPAGYGSSDRIIFGKVSQCKDFAIGIRPDGKIAAWTATPSQGTRHYSQTASAVTLNTWHHVVGVYDAASSKLKLYVDGVMVNENVFPADTSNTDPLRIGNSSCCGEHFNGLVDETRLFNRALSDAEIQAIYASTLGGCMPDPSVSPINIDFGNVAVETTTAPQIITVSNQSGADLHLLSADLSETTHFILDTAAGTTPCGSIAASNVFEQFRSYNGHLYAVTKSAYTWDSARTLAISNGGYLSTINDLQEQQFIWNNYSGYGAQWVGFNDIAAEGSWIWANGETPGFTYWNGGEPNNSGNEDCAAIGAGTGGSWNDAACTTGYRALVEWNTFNNMPVIPAGGSCTLGVSYKATRSANQGVYAGVLTIGSEASGYTRRQVSLQGTSSAPRISPNYSSFNFGSVLTNNTSSVLDITVTNNGNATLHMNTVTIGSAEFRIKTDACSNQAIAPDANCHITTDYHPTVSGAANTTLSIPSDDPYTPAASISLSGSGFSNQIAVNPTSFTFSGPQNGANPDSQNLAISNLHTGTMNWNITYSNAAWLSLSSSSGTNAGTIALNMNTAGLIPGTYSTTLYVNAADTINSGLGVPVSLTVTGPNISVNPASLDFIAPVGGSSFQKSITVTNIGNQNLVFSSFDFTGTDSTEFGLQSNCTTVAPGGTCALNVTMTSAVAGSKSATLTVGTDDIDTPAKQIPLTGNARTPRVSAQYGLNYLVNAAKAWQNSNNCYGCHVQAHTIAAASIAKAHQFTVNDADVSSLITKMQQHYNVVANSNQSFYSYYAGGGGGLLTDSTQYAASALVDYNEMVSPSYTTEIVRTGNWLMTRRSGDGRVPEDHYNAPVAQGDILSTANSIRIWKEAYNRTSDAQYLDAINLAAGWLRGQITAIISNPTGYTTQDKVYSILGLFWSGVPDTDADILRIKDRLLLEQRSDGSWLIRNNCGLSSPYGTGEVLFSLKQIGISDTNPAILRGTHWLINYQQPDGSWPMSSCDDDSLIPSAMWAVIGLVSYDVISVNISSPADGTRVTAPINIVADAADNQGNQITKIQVYVDNLLFAEADAASISVSWNPAGYADGFHEIKVVSTNSAGFTGSKTINIITGNLFITSVSVNPNPFDPNKPESATINYSLLVNSTVAADIYDSIQNQDGQWVPNAPIRSLMPNTQKNYGNYQLIWDGRNSSNQVVGTGFYFMKIAASDGNGSQEVFEKIGVYPSNVIASISGTVRSQTGGAAISGAVVEALKNGSVISSAITTASGLYKINLLLAGTYDLRASGAGYRPDAIAHTGIQVTTGQNITGEDFSLRPNQFTPVIAAISDQTLNEGDSLNLPVTVTDGDGDTVAITVSGLPAFGSFQDNGNNTATILFMPSVNDSGSYSFTLTADDGMNSSSKTVNLTVNDSQKRITATSGAHGSITPAGDVVVGNGTSRNFDIAADNGYYVASVTDTCGGEGYTNTSSDVAAYSYTAGPVTENCAVTASFASNQCIASYSGLLAWWPGNGNAYDAVGSNNGTVAGGVSHVAGRVNQSFSFDGTGYIDLTETIQFDANNFTIQGWIKTGPDNSGSMQQIWNSGYNAGSPDADLELVVQNNLLRLHARDSAGSAIGFDSSHSVGDNAWHHFAAVRNGSTFAFYVDGQLSGSETAGLGDIDSAGVLPRIGNGLAGIEDRFFHGMLDEVQIYNRALTQSEILVIYSAGSSGVCGMPNIMVTPASKNFGDLNLNSSSSVQRFTFMNTGNTDLHVTGLQPSGDIGMFIVVPGSSNPCSSGSYIAAPGYFCTYDVTFRPTSAGVKTATMTISSDDPDMPALNVSIRGNGIFIDNINPTAVLSAPATVNYGAGFTLDGSGSTDVGGTVVQYRWTSLTGSFPGLTQNVEVSTSVSTFVVGANTAAPGNYTFQLVVQDSAGNLSAPGTRQVTIVKASATVTLSNLTQIFDGNPKPVTVATVPPGLAVTVLYNDSATVPSAVGSYNVVATVNDANYQGSTSGTLQINKNTYTYTVNKSGNGTITSNPAGLVCGATSCTGEFPFNAKVVLSFKPARGSRVVNVRVNGVNLGAMKTVTLRNLKKPPVIVVVFSP